MKEDFDHENMFTLVSEEEPLSCSTSNLKINKVASRIVTEFHWLRPSNFTDPTSFRHSLVVYPSPTSPALFVFAVVARLVSILFAASQSISRNKNFTEPINYTHFIFITWLHRPGRRDNSPTVRPASRDLAPAPPRQVQNCQRGIGFCHDGRYGEKNLRPAQLTSKTVGLDQ